MLMQYMTGFSDWETGFFHTEVSQVVIHIAGSTVIPTVM